MITNGIINVLHECEDGFHEFTSPQLPGLYVVVEKDDLKGAYDDIPAVIQELIFADHGVRVSVKQQQSYSEYLDGLPDSFKPNDPVWNYYIEKMAA